MNIIFKTLFLLITGVHYCYGQQGTEIKEQMVYLGAYNAGQPGVNIYKMFDKTEDVLCYIMMPTIAAKRQMENGQWVFESNTVGTLSCMKAFALPPRVTDNAKKK